MNKIKPLLLLVSTLSSSLLSCSHGNGIAYEMPDNYPDSNRRLVSPSDYIVDFSLGGSDRFVLANGYKNPDDMFDCYWSRNSGKIEDNLLKLTLSEKNGKYYGAEYRSRYPEFSYGYYATSMKPAKCSGVISSFFTHINYPEWNEIDIEFLGKNTTQVQFNYYANGITTNGYVYQLKFDASLEFHEYGFEWLKDSITWYIDGIKVYKVTANIPQYNQQLLMNIWNCKGIDHWSGTFDPSGLPVTAQYRFIAYIPAN